MRRGLERHGPTKMLDINKLVSHYKNFWFPIICSFHATQAVQSKVLLYQYISSLISRHCFVTCIREASEDAPLENLNGSEHMADPKHTWRQTEVTPTQIKIIALKYVHSYTISNMTGREEVGLFIPNVSTHVVDFKSIQHQNRCKRTFLTTTMHARKRNNATQNSSAK